MVKQRSLRVAGLFAGIGGIELGLQRAGHHATLLCESDPAAQAVLRARFPGVPVLPDVRAIDRLPSETELVAAGFPCQDLSQAGGTKGIRGERSGLVAEVFRLLEQQEIPHVLIENVPFMLQLGRGAAMDYIVQNLERLGYRWAYRVIDTRSFGVPQRRERVYLFASREWDPAHYLFGTNHSSKVEGDYEGRACGFYWTEGVRGLGWAVEAVPTLKGGSGLGIASPPAIWLPDGRMVTPDIRDAERLQGFRSNWTKPAEQVTRAGFRWKLVGNAVSVPVAKWLGDKLAREPVRLPAVNLSGIVHRAWPRGACERGGVAHEVVCTTWPVKRKQVGLQSFLRFPTKELSLRATVGFESRLASSTLRAPSEFKRALKTHINRMREGVA